MKLFSNAILLASLLLLSINVQAFKVKADELLLLVSMVSNQTSYYVVKNKELAVLPDWDGSGTAPLTIEDATNKALNKHKEKNTKAKLRSISLKSKTVHCGKDQDCPESLWYYKAKVKGGKKMTYIILMDGSFVNPKKK